MLIKHTKDSIKLLEFLQRNANTWNSIAQDKKTLRALKRAIDLDLENRISYDPETKQARYELTRRF